MRISRELYDEMVAHALATRPTSAAGWSPSRDGEAVAVHRPTNAAASPLRYEIDGAEQYRIQMGSTTPDTTSGRSTTRTPAARPYPSQTDINLAFYPEALYMIVGLAAESPRSGRSRSGTAQ